MLLVMSSRMELVEWSLVVLSRVMYCSSSARTLYPRIEAPVCLSLHRWFRTIAVKSVTGRDISWSKSPKSRRRRAASVRLSIWSLSTLISLVPTLSLPSQCTSSCSRDPSSLHPCVLHMGELTLPKWCSLDWGRRRSWSIHQRKLARSGGIPGCLQFSQDISQSVAGLALSALHGVNNFSPVPLSVLVIVILFSVSSLLQSFSVIFRMFSTDASLTSLII